MAPDQIVLFTLHPQGATVSGDQMPVSVFVAPRLYNGDRLGQFPDWLRWTRELKERGLPLTLHCGGKTFDTAINTDVLQPELWEQLFHENTLVRSHAYDDYTEHGIISFSARETLSTLKGLYQQASVDLALPETPGDTDQREGSLNRRRLADLTDGLNVHWDGRQAPKWRALNRTRHRPDAFTGALAFAPPPGVLDSEGLYVQPRTAAQMRQTAQDFSVFHHMPTPDRDEHPLALDNDNVLDFHQALSALNAYPALLRALGLVFDLELSRAFVPETPFDKFNTLSVHKTTFGWQTATQTPELRTAYVHTVLGALRLFVPAPRIFNQPNETPPNPKDPPSPTTVLGLLDLDSQKFGVAQVDFDGAMHKAIMLADSLNDPDPHSSLDSDPRAEPAAHPEVFDPGATLPSLRSGGFQLYADRRGLALFAALTQSKTFDQALMSNNSPSRPFFAEDLLRGYRLDVWEATSGQWRSLHWRRGDYTIGSLQFNPGDDEGFLQTGATQSAPGAMPADKDLYLHEAFARWVGWSLSAPRPSKTMSAFADPAKAVPDDADPQYATDQPLTPFKMQVKYTPVPGTLPSLRFGRRYRFRARAVDLAGNSLKTDDAFGALLAQVWGIPQNPEGFAYLRYEPVAAPLVVLRDPLAVQEPGSALDRLVIRTFNVGVENDGQLADTHAADRHLVPPRSSVELGERMGMFDDAAGKLKGDPAMWDLIATRDESSLPSASFNVAGYTREYPLVTDESISALPYLPDWYSRGVAIRDLPHSDNAVLARIVGGGTGGSGAQPIAYTPLNDPNPRPGSATLIPFGDTSDWQTLQGLRFALAEPAAMQNDLRPTWDADKRLLTVFLEKGETTVVPVTSYLNLEDMKQMGVWQWLREYIERLAITQPHPDALGSGVESDRIAHVLQRAVEGGHWMLTPPRLLTLVHAVQQPLGKPAFTALPVNLRKLPSDLSLETEPIVDRRDPTELAPITAWRVLNANDAYLLGALKVHGASTEKVDIQAVWDDFVDDPSDPANLPGVTLARHAAPVDEIPLRSLAEGYLSATGTPTRRVGYYDPEHDQIAWTRVGEFTGEPDNSQLSFQNAAPRHQINDAKHHRITYTAVATSRYREYFDPTLDFTRSSAPVEVDVPASARPLAPDVAYVLPTFGWQRQTDTNMQRSVRFGGGLRVYLHRPWYSSGNGELLGVALWNHTQYGPLNNDRRVQFKPYITQWGMDPIWDSAPNLGWPAISDFKETVAFDQSVLLEERNALGPDGKPGRVDVVGYPTFFDPDRKLWYADLTLNFLTDTYMPFVRLALTRYQPNALEEVKISRVVLADFAQLTPTRVALITSDPHHARTLRVVVSGVAPRGPQASAHEPGQRPISAPPTQIRIRLQERIPSIPTDLGWQDAPTNAATIHADFDGLLSAAAVAAHAGVGLPVNPDLALWAGAVAFDTVPDPGRYRLLIEETEHISANYTLSEGNIPAFPGRLVYAETIMLDTALLQE